MVEIGWYGILQIIGALALFMYGMKVMSEGVQRIASVQLRDALQRVTQNRISSFITGFITTAAIQSSSATTIMTVSFVNARIISLAAAAGIIIGANAGTVVTVWFVTILGFELSLFTLCLPLIAFAMPFIYVQNGKYRQWAETIIGFSLLLIALEFLKSVVPELQRQSQIMEFLGQLGNHGLLSVLLFVLMGFLFTALIQSSSAAMALTLTMCLNGWLPFDIAAIMVLGENIGTTIATEVASWVGNKESKKAARIHVLFNIIGVLVFLPFLPLLIPFIEWVMVDVFQTTSPITDTKSMPVGLAAFYTLFNLVCAVFFLLFMDKLIHLASRTLRHIKEDEGKVHFIDTGLNTADLSLPVALQEIIQQCQRIKHINTILNQIVNFTTESDFQDKIKLVREYFHTFHVTQKALNQYLTGMVEDKSSLFTSRQIKILLHAHLLLDQIRSKYDQIYRLLSDKKQQRIWFGPTQRSMLLHRINDAQGQLNRCIQLLQTTPFGRSMSKGISIDVSDRNLEYQEFESELVSELERGEMKLASVVIYYRIAQLLDGINDSLRAMVGEFGDEPIASKVPFPI